MLGQGVLFTPNYMIDNDKWYSRTLSIKMMFKSATVAVYWKDKDVLEIYNVEKLKDALREVEQKLGIQLEPIQL